MSGISSLARAGRWFLHSGIQESSGGVARFYLADLRKNKPISTEITGYAASVLVFLYTVTGEEEYLASARRAADFLCDHAWDEPLQTFPFEHPGSSHAYFFDCGIIIRGLLAVWRVTKEDRLLDMAIAASRGMIADFHSGIDYHPILLLPEKQPLERLGNWSKFAGCYQTKSALAWWEVGEITGDRELQAAYLEMVQASLETYRDFLPGSPDRLRVMDRLHAAAYFLEGMSPILDREDCRNAYEDGLRKISVCLREIAPDFARSDVYAQLLRARVFGAKWIPLDRVLARQEAEALEAFQTESVDQRVDGSFLFGRRGDEFVPHANPVSTAFALQALHAWGKYEAGDPDPCVLPPI